MRGVKYILALTLAMAGASALAYNGGYENHYVDEIAGYTGYGNDDIMYAEPFPNAAKNQVFAQCRAVTSLNLSGQSVVSEIGNASFAYMGITSLTIPSCVQSVGYISFGGCSNLTEVSCDSWNWADGTADIEDKEPFRDCFKLKTLRVSGSAAEPPTSFDVTVVFTELTTVYCPASKVSLWQAAYPSLTIIGVPEATTFGLMNGTFSAAFSAASPEEAAEIASAMEVVLTEEDVAAGLKPEYLCVVVAPVGNVVPPSQGSMDSFSATPTSGDVSYYAYVDVNPETVEAPIIGSSTGSPMPVVQDSDGVKVDIYVNNAVQGLWYGCEVKDALSDPFVYDVDSFVRAPEGGIVVVPCTKRTSEAAFFRVRVTATKPTAN